MKPNKNRMQKKTEKTKQNETEKEKTGKGRKIVNRKKTSPQNKGKNG